MNSNDRRLDQLSTGLSARERAIMRLRAFKEGDPEPSGLYRSTPDYQIPEVNDLLALANVTHREITWYAVWLQSRMEATSLRGSVVAALHFAAMRNERIQMHFLFNTSEPTTVSQHVARLAAAREELIPVAELAEWLADYRAEESPTAEAVRLRASEVRLREMVADGTLPGRGRGRTLAIPAGAFSDWCGQPVPLLPEWGILFEVFPDEAAGQVERLRTERESLRSLFHPGDALDARLDGLSEAITETTASELRALWAELLAVDAVVREVAEQFDGEEPLHPESRALLNETKERVLALVRAPGSSLGEADLPAEPEPQVRKALAAVIEQEAGRW